MSYLKNNIGSSSVQKWTEVATNNTAVGNSTNTNRHRSASLFDLLPSDPIGGIPRTSRSLSFSEPSFSSSLGLGYGFGPSRAGYDQDDEDVLRFRPPLTIMEEEYEDSIEPRLRARSCSSSAVSLDAFPNGLPSMFTTGSGSKDPFGVSSGSKATMGNSQPPSMNRQLSDELSAWPTSTRSEAASSSHRRSITTMSSYGTPIWESSCPVQPLPAPIERDRQRLARRFSVAPSSDFRNYGVFLDDVEAGNSSALSLNRFDSDTVHQQVQRRHSVAGFGESYRRSSTTAFALTSSLESLQLENDNQTGVWGLNEELHEEDVNPGHGSNTKELGKGVSLGQLPHRGALYVVEFKAGRNDLFYVTESSGLSLKSGDLVIVEADRGKDLGKITHDSITPQHIQALQEHQAEMAAMQLQQEGVAAGNGSHRAAKEIHPKRIFRLAQSSEISQLIYKNQDEIKAMIVCQSKVRQKRLPMEVVDAEYQWDRRKLTFYFVAERRIDFRELVRDLFKIYKTRIWMYAVSPSMAQSSIGRLHSGSSPLHVNAHIDHRMEQQQQQHQQQQPAFHQPKQQQYHLDAHPVCHQGYRYGSNYGCSQGDATAGAASSMGPHPHSSLLGAMSTSTYPHSQHSRSQHFQY
ncbi:hypothetical protein BGX28_009091 [Mortierella sp. GBA30]|nr:hypothetical protein BGX28_009091 [Mortierella sp. GBA30]